MELLRDDPAVELFSAAWGPKKESVTWLCSACLSDTVGIPPETHTQAHDICDLSAALYVGLGAGAAKK